VTGLGLDGAELGPQHDRAAWPAMRVRFAEVFATRTRDEWVARFAGHDACVAPVNTTEDTFADPHMVARGTVVEPGGVAQPAPAPRFSGTPAAVDRPPPEIGEHTDDVLAELGYDAAAVETLRRAGAVA
jgi:alpha-methylacyl-CoA racemase